MQGETLLEEIDARTDGMVAAEKMTKTFQTMNQELASENALLENTLAKLEDEEQIAKTKKLDPLLATKRQLLAEVGVSIRQTLI